MRGGVLRPDRADREPQVPSDHLGDLADRNAFVADRVQGRPRRRQLHREAEEACGIRAMDGRPAVDAVAQVAGHTLVACDVDQRGDESMITSAVNRRRETEHRRANPARRERQRVVRIGQPGMHPGGPHRGDRFGIAPIAFGRDAARRQSQRPRGDDQRTAGALERRAEGLNRKAVRLGGAREPSREGDVVLERQVDDAIRSFGSITERSRSSMVPRSTSAPAAVR